MESLEPDERMLPLQEAVFLRYGIPDDLEEDGRELPGDPRGRLTEKVQEDPVFGARKASHQEDDGVRG